MVRPEVVGMDVFDTELIEHRVMTRHYKYSGQRLAMAYSDVEIALWDARARGFSAARV